MVLRRSVLKLRYFALLVVVAIPLLYGIMRLGGIHLRQRLVESIQSVRESYLIDHEGRQLGSGLPLPPHVDWNAIRRPASLGASTVSSGASVKEWTVVHRVGESPPLFLVQRLHIPRKFLDGVLLPFVIVAAFFVSLLATGVVVFYATRRGREALSVLGRLRAGDLKARFQITRLDEIGRTMVVFNEMADEIERLVDRLRLLERSRTELLRELAHDLRTPLQSIGYRLEGLASDPAEASSEAIRTGLRELLGDFSYFRRLIEDLFLLAQADDNLFTPSLELVDPLDWIESESERVARDFPHKRLSIAADLPSEARIKADRFLLRRLLGNALENAFHFARSEVKVEARCSPTQIEIRVRDDGPGLEDHAIATFGSKRTSRFLETGSAVKVSIGLGSVVMKKVARILGGSVQPGNWQRDDGARGGAEFRIQLPISDAVPERKAG